uniref:Uncharacterized protein n=1 Tax=Arundo donax TaxID=35708 RepID=A0A0A9A332_ARUDO
MPQILHLSSSKRAFTLFSKQLVQSQCF